MISSYHRPTGAKVSLDNIGRNLKTIQASLPEKTQAWAVVKADAYGHGAVKVAAYLEERVSGFCLSNLDEALELRQAGIQAPLLVMGVVPVDLVELAIQEKVQLTATSLEWVENLLDKNINLVNLSLQIKYDSGMGRLGFQTHQEINKAIDLMASRGIRITGIFTHFASADELDQSQLQEQLRVFKDLLEGLDRKPDLIHASNSAASLWHQDTIFSGVRLGNALYGFNPSGHSLDLPYTLYPALSLSSQLVQIKYLPKGSRVGYGGTYETSEEEWIGTVPIGYADGLTRDMQGFDVLVDGQRCEIVGRVSMDQITIRLPKSYPLGSRVTLIGQDGGEEITAQDWADYRKTINYEVVCLLTDRIPRYYD